jgi:hypothetical protein
MIYSIETLVGPRLAVKLKDLYITYTCMKHYILYMYEYTVANS